MILLKDNMNRPQPCLYLIEMPNYQPLTQEIFYKIQAVGYDGIRRTTLFLFFNEIEMHEKYLELHQEYMRQAHIELNDRMII